MINSKIHYLEDRMITGKEFDKLLLGIMEANKNISLYIQYIVKYEFNNHYKYISYGKSKTEGQKISQTDKLNDGFEIEINLWQDKESFQLDDFIKLFHAFWKDSKRDNTTGLISRDIISKEICNNTLQTWLQNDKKIAFFLVDLDHFKNVNDSYGHQTGSSVIKQFSKLLLGIISKKGILIHQSGDEFNLLYPYYELTEIIGLAYIMRQKVNIYSFDGIDNINLTMAMGVYLLDKENRDIEEIRSLAEKAYDNKGKNCTKQRDSIRIIRENNNSSYGEYNIKLALTRIISSAGKNIFHNIFLDSISNYISKQSIDNKRFIETIDGFINWINPDETSDIRCTVMKNSSDTEARLSYIDISFAILNGVMHNNHFKNIMEVGFSIGDECNGMKRINVTLNKENVFNKCLPESTIKENNFKWTGKFLHKYIANFKRVVLIKCGYDTNIEIPEDIFFDIVEVDTRPTLGGALPDLWAGALSALIRDMKNNTDFSDIILFGSFEKTKKIKEYMDSVGSWDRAKISYISYKTFRTESEIETFKEKFSNHIFVCTDKSKLIDKLYDIYTQTDFLTKSKSYNWGFSGEKQYFLKRNLSLDDIALDKLSGCKAESIHDAFPIVLEILKSSAEKNNNDYIIDQAGRKLYELIDFRISLEKPNSARLPEYYKYDEIDMDKYYNETFGNDDGLFRKEIIKDDQLDNMINHIIGAIKNRGKRYATRRAILVIPNKNNHLIGNERYPLGLVSIWLAPRFYNEEVILNYSYSWRTVEALDGLPRSMYASVRFAEELKQQIEKKCGFGIYLGKVSYIAHSLHMFLDDESKRIIRGIINDASF